MAVATLLLTGAALGDRFGRRRMFTIGLALFVTGSIGCAVAGGIATLIVARTLGAFGIAMLVAAFSRCGGPASAAAFASGFQAAMGLSALVSFLGAVAGLGRRRRVG